MKRVVSTQLYGIPSFHNKDIAANVLGFSTMGFIPMLDFPSSLPIIDTISDNASIWDTSANEMCCKY